MDKKEFENLGVQDKEIIFNEMLELVTLIYENPVSIEELKIFTEWHKYIAKFSNDLYRFLIGVYPYPELNKQPSKEVLTELLKCSNEALKLVSFWNNQIKKQLEHEEEKLNYKITE